MPTKPLAQQMGTYASCHRDPVNKGVHFVFVPLIVWSAMGLLLLPGGVFVAGLHVTAAHVATLVLLAFYLRLDFSLGVAMVCLFTVLLVTAIGVQQMTGGRALGLFAAVFLLSGAAQLVGHRFFEGRKPAFATRTEDGPAPRSPRGRRWCNGTATLRAKSLASLPVAPQR